MFQAMSVKRYPLTNALIFHHTWCNLTIQSWHHKNDFQIENICVLSSQSHLHTNSHHSKCVAFTAFAFWQRVPLCERKSDFPFCDGVGGTLLSVHVHTREANKYAWPWQELNLQFHHSQASFTPQFFTCNQLQCSLCMQQTLLWKNTDYICYTIT